MPPLVATESQINTLNAFNATMQRREARSNDDHALMLLVAIVAQNLNHSPSEARLPEQAMVPPPARACGDKLTELQEAAARVLRKRRSIAMASSQVDDNALDDLKHVLIRQGAWK